MQDDTQVLLDKERTRLLIEHIMGWFLVEQTAKGGDMPDIPKGVYAAAGFGWPIAFWNTDAECWVMRDIADNTNTLFFDPLHDFNDAWCVLQKLKEREETLPEREKFTISRTFMAALGVHAYDSWGLPAITFWSLVSLTPERICLAALKAVGVVVTE